MFAHRNRNLWRYPDAFKELSVQKCGAPIERAGKQLNGMDICSQSDVSGLRCHQIDPILIRKRIYSFSVRHSKESNQLIIEVDRVNLDLMLLIIRKQTNETTVEMAMSGAATVTCLQNLKLTVKLRITSAYDIYLFCAPDRLRLPSRLPFISYSTHIATSEYLHHFDLGNRYRRFVGVFVEYFSRLFDRSEHLAEANEKIKNRATIAPSQHFRGLRKCPYSISICANQLAHEQQPKVDSTESK